MKDLQKTIKHFQSLQKRYTTQHNGNMCDRVQDALEALYEYENRRTEIEENPDTANNEPVNVLSKEKIIVLLNNQKLVSIDGCTVIENNPHNVKVGDIIYAYDPNTNEKYSSSIGEIAINKFGITLNDIYSHTICPACKLDSNENWGPYLYFSSDKKRQEYIDNI